MRGTVPSISPLLTIMEEHPLSRKVVHFFLFKCPSATGIPLRSHPCEPAVDTCTSVHPHSICIPLCVGHPVTMADGALCFDQQVSLERPIFLHISHFLAGDSSKFPSSSSLYLGGLSFQNCGMSVLLFFLYLI